MVVVNISRITQEEFHDAVYVIMLLSLHTAKIWC